MSRLPSPLSVVLFAAALAHNPFSNAESVLKSSIAPEILEQLKKEASNRAPVLERPLVFSRAQVKYNLGINYYNTWRDRPLFNNAKWRIPTPFFTPPEAWREMLFIAKDSELDGLAFFPETNGRSDVFPLTAQANVEDVKILPEFIPTFDENGYKAKSGVIKKALASKEAVRVNGKVLITSYNAQEGTPEQWNAILTRLKQEHGDTFLFLPALAIAAELRVKSYEEGKGEIRKENIEEVKRKLRTYLDVTDGLYFHYPPALRNKDGSFDDEFYRDMLIAVMKSVLGEPEYKGKLLGLSAYRAHLNPDYGNNLSDDLTRTLRRSLGTAVEAQPDVIVLPEWDEFNENTCFMPTVYTGMTTKRLLRYYNQKLKGKPLTPIAGDDESLPNLILSSRKLITLGEKLEFELLNVPDTDKEARYSVVLTLSDENGKVLKTLEAIDFTSNQLKEHRFSLPSEEFSNARAVIPTLTIRKANGEEMKIEQGLYPVQLRTSWNWDYLAAKQPIRDLIRPEKAEIKWTDKGIEATFKAPEELAYVEIIGDGGEVYVFDPKDEFFRNGDDRELYLIEYRSHDDANFTGRATVKGTKGHWWHDTNVGQHSRSRAISFSDTEIQFQSDRSKHQRVIYLAAEKSENGMLELDLGGETFEVPLKEIREQKIVAKNFPSGLHVIISPFTKQFDIPKELGKTEATFTVPVTPEIGTEQFVLQAIAKSGKTYRSRPLLIPRDGSTKQVPLRVYSETQQKGLDVTVDEDRIPKIDYDFAPKRGAVLYTEAGRPFWASLGGFSNATTGRGMPVSIDSFGEPGVVKNAPAWKEIDGKQYLEFDGKTSYIHLPKETFPHRGAFELTMNILPNGDSDTYALVTAHLRHKREAFTLRVERGQLVGTFIDSDWQIKSFRSRLRVPQDKWSEIKVSYNFEKMTFEVNGESASFECTFPAGNAGYCVFGLGRKGVPGFAGLLGNISITHNAAPAVAAQKD